MTRNLTIVRIGGDDIAALSAKTGKTARRPQDLDIALARLFPAFFGFGVAGDDSI
jgi:hypothetical protein